MTEFKNNPGLKDSTSSEAMVKRYVHQPLENDHYGIHFKITEGGKVIISTAGVAIGGDPEEMEYDEVEIPASLVFKLATLLKATRTIKYVSMSEAAKMPKLDE